MVTMLVQGRGPGYGCRDNDKTRKRREVCALTNQKPSVIPNRKSALQRGLELVPFHVQCVPGTALLC